MKIKNTLRSKDKAEKAYDVLRHIQLHMSQYNKMKICNPLRQTYTQLLFKSRFPTTGQTYRRQVVNPYPTDHCNTFSIALHCTHFGDVIMGAIASQITSLTVVYSTFIQTQIKENIKAPRHWPLCGESTGDRWIPRTNGQWRGNCFHLMTSSCKSPPTSYAPSNSCCTLNVRKLQDCHVRTLRTLWPLTAEGQ